jgi:hypothetical protein
MSLASQDTLCRNGFYLVQQRELIRFDERAQRHLPVSELPVQVNALAYIQKEEVFYGMAGKRFVTITASGELTDRGPAPSFLEGAYAAASDGPHWIVQGGHDIFTLDTPALTVVSKVPVTQDLGDWDFNPADGMLYGVAAGKQPSLVRIDPSTGASAVVAQPPGLAPGSNYGAAAIDLYGTLHVLHNSTGQVYHIPLSSPASVTSSALDLKAFHADAASCPAGFDYGNSPESDARHTVTTFGVLSLGAVVGSDDGLSSAVSVAAEATSLSLPVQVRNTTGQPALLAGWHDLDHDGQFTAPERASVVVRPGDESVNLDWPQIKVDPGSDESRLRLRLFGLVPTDPLPHGFASGGEVEDYPITIRWPEPRPFPPPASPSPTVPPSAVPTPSALPPSMAPPPAALGVPNPPGRHKIPLTLTLFTGLLVPAITVAARGGVRKGAR